MFSLPSPDVTLIIEILIAKIYYANAIFILNSDVKFYDGALDIYFLRVVIGNLI